jgi:type IV pilus assembly protein PilV
MNKPSHLRRNGYSLFEMLVSILIISFGLLGVLALQGQTLKASVTSEDAQRAALLASDMAAAILNANTVNVSQGVIDSWAAKVADPSSGGVPSGVGTVAVTSANSARISVVWTPSGAASAVHNYVTDVILP